MTRTKALGRERIARKLSDSLPGGENPPRGAVWQFMRPMLSPNLAQVKAVSCTSSTICTAVGNAIRGNAMAEQSTPAAPR
jgi:hypothetical protein